MRRDRFFALAVASGVIAAIVAAGDKDTPDDSFPQVIAVTFHATDAKDAKALKTLVTSVRTKFEDKNVLFLDVDGSSRSSRHQAKLLLNTISLAEVWKTYSKSPGKLVLVDTASNEVLKAYTAKDGAKAIEEALGKQLNPAASAEAEEEEDEEDDGCSDGCSEDDSDDGGDDDGSR